MLTMLNPIDFGGHSSKVNVTMGIIDKSWVRGDATLCVVIFLHNCFPFTATIMKLYTQTHYQSRIMCPIDLGLKGQRLMSHCIDYRKWFMLQNSFPITPIIMKLNIKFLMSWGCALLILGSKGQCHDALITENGFWYIIALPLHLFIIKRHSQTPHERSKVKVTMLW